MAPTLPPDVTKSIPNLLVGTSFAAHWNQPFCVAFLPWDVLFGVTFVEMSLLFNWEPGICSVGLVLVPWPNPGCLFVLRTGHLPASNKLRQRAEGF